MRREKWERAPSQAAGSVSGDDGTKQAPRSAADSVKKGDGDDHEDIDGGACAGVALRERLECLYIDSGGSRGQDRKPKSAREECMDALRTLAYECVDEQVSHSMNLRYTLCTPSTAR